MSQVTDSLKVLTKIWGNREGYVFLPWIDGDATEDNRKSKYHEGRAFDWPKEKEAVQKHLEAHTNDDVYFCPNLFLMKRRATNVAAEERALWADLDEVNPETLDEDLRPTIAWESSPGRYQAIWLLTRDALLASEAGGLGQRLTYHIGADLGGWDSTQLLRPPGWRNHKPKYREQYGEAPQGKLLWKVGPRYTPEELDEALPHLEVIAPGADEVLEQEIEAVNRHQVMARVRNKLSVEAKQVLRARHAEGDRSDKLYFLEVSLAEVGCTAAEIIAIVRETVWNKFAGRNDELKRLKIEAGKAIQKARQTRDEESDFEIADRTEPQKWATLAAQMSKPQWLIDDIWTKGACGIIGGAPKSMKSYISLDLIVSIISGEPFLGRYAVKDPGPVLYIQEEDPVPEVDMRLERITRSKAPDFNPTAYMETDGTRSGTKWAESKLELYAKVREGLVFTEPEDQEWLDEQLSKREYRALIMDPMGMFLGDIDDHRFGEMNTHFLKPLKQLAEKHKVAIILVHHTSKSADAGKGRIGSALLGSRALHAWTEDYLYVHRHSDQSNKLTIQRESKRAAGLRFKMNPSFASFGWQPNLQDEDASYAADAEVRANEPAPKDQLRAYQALAELGAGAHTTKVIADHLGIKPNGAYKQLARLRDRGIAASNGEGWTLIDT